MKRINGYGILALFLLLQVPLALLPSTLTTEPLSQASGANNDSTTRRTPMAKPSEFSLSGPLEYLRILCVISCFWIPLIYMDRTSAGSVGSWIARIGYVVLGGFWLIFANGRLEDAGWGHSLYPSQYFLVVGVAALMPLAIHWVNSYEALAIFFLIQIPTVFLKSKERLEESPSS